MRRRQDKPTVRLETVPTMQDIARQWHAALNESSGPHCPTAAANGRRDQPDSNIPQGE